MRAKVEALAEQNFNRRAARDGTKRNLRGVVKFAQPVLRFVRGLGRVNDLIRHQQTDLEANVVRRQNFLTRDQRGRFAQVAQAQREFATSADLFTGA